MNPLILASGNPGKLREFRQFFAAIDPLWELKPADLEVEETGETFAANAIQKAQTVALALGSWTIADDSGLAVDALGGSPGVFSARYADSDPARIARLLGELAGVTQRGAEFVCAIAVSDPTGQIAALAEGSCRGEILLQPRGEGGFGYDPVFWVPELGRTFAELSTEEKQQISHRGRALQALRSQLLALR